MKISASLANWETDKKTIKFIRQCVFIKEQSVPEEMEWDKHDKTATHCLAWLEDKAIATGRLQADGQLGRMAVLKPYRHHGAGTLVLEFLIQQHQQRSDRPLVIHAQTHAINFYNKFGFIKQGQEYKEAGIPHYTMILNK